MIRDKCDASGEKLTDVQSARGSAEVGEILQCRQQHLVDVVDVGCSDGCDSIDGRHCVPRSAPPLLQRDQSLSAIRLTGKKLREAGRWNLEKRKQLPAC